MPDSRLFIAINIPNDIRRELVGLKEKYPDLPAKWTEEQNIHITLVFIGEVKEKQVPEIHKIISEVAKGHKPFSLKLSNIYYGPLKIIPPRMVWLTADESKDFLSLKKDLEKSLSIKDKKEGIAHITLARIKEWAWRSIEPEERQEVNEFVDYKILVNSIELMQSVLKRSGPEYKIVESYKL